MSSINRQQSQFSSTSSITPNYHISINTLIVWVFCLENLETCREVSPLQIMKMKNLYGRFKEFFNPVISIENLPSALRKIDQFQIQKKRKYVIKLCISMAYLREPGAVDAIKAASVVQVCIVCDEHWEHREIDRLRRKFDNNKHLIFSQDMNEVLKVATKQVQNFTKSSRTFHNSIPLVKQTAQTVNLYRFRLISCIHIRASDQESRAEQFEDFAFKKFDEMNLIKSVQNEGSNGLGILNFAKQLSFVDIFTSYKQVVAEHYKSINNINEIKNKQERQVQKSKQNYCFWNKIIDIYQKQGFFYQIINNYLRIFKEPQSQWQPLAQPISYIYQSVKGLHRYWKKEKKDQFYSKPFTVYRGGRIKYTQVEQLFQASLKIKNNSSFKMEDIIALLKEFQSEKVQLNSKCQQLYIEFFSFLSTTLSQYKAINTFLQNKRQCDQQTDQTKDYGCIFKIDVANVQYLKCPENLRHGYYKFTSEQSEGESEEQVMFNVLNVFKLKSIKKMSINGDAELVDYSDLSSEAVFYIQLQYGPFEQMVFHTTIDQLSDYQRNIRLNYCNVYRKMMTAEGFDIADAYQQTNQLQKCQKYYESKLLIGDSVISSSTGDEERFSLSKKDNKNYMLSLCRIYQKRGKTQKAIEASKLVIKCYKFLQREGETSIYLGHMQKIEEMQEKIVDIVQKSQSVVQRKQFLRLKRLQVSRQYQNDPSKELKLTELDLAEGVLQFQKGQLEDSLNFFRKAQKNMVGFIKNLRNIKAGSFVKQYLKNLICCCFQQPLDRWVWKYPQFSSELKAIKIKEIGGEDQGKIDSILFSAIQLFCKTADSIEDRIKSLKSPQEFKSILSRFNHEISLLDFDLQQVESMHQPQISFIERQTTDQIKVNMKKIKNKIIALKKDRNNLSQQAINHRKQEIIALIENYKSQKSFFIIDDKGQKDQSIFEKFIQYFYKQERERKLKMIKQKMQKAKLAKKVVNQELNGLISQIQQFITNLKSQCYSESNIQIIQSRNEWAKIALEKLDYTLARQQITLILQNGDNEIQVKYQQLAKAHKINGCLQLQMQNYNEAITQLTKSIQFEVIHTRKTRYAKDIQANEIQFDLFQNSINQTYSNLELRRAPIETYEVNFQLFSFNNNFLQAQLLRCKACLYQARRLHKFILSQYKKKMANQCKQIVQERQKLMNLVKKTIEELRVIFRIRELKFKAGNLEVIFPEILGLYQLSSSKNVTTAFQHFKVSLDKRDSLYSENCYQSLIMCCQIIYEFSDIKEVYVQLIAHKFVGRINQYMLNNEDRENQSWKFYKALYFMQKHGKNEVVKKKQYLKSAIQRLEQLNQAMLQNQIAQLKYELKRCLNTEKFRNEEWAKLYSKDSLLERHRDGQADGQTHAMNNREQYEFQLGNSVKTESVFRSLKRNWLNDRRNLGSRNANSQLRVFNQLRHRVQMPNSEKVIVRKPRYPIPANRVQ